MMQKVGAMSRLWKSWFCNQEIGQIVTDVLTRSIFMIELADQATAATIPGLRGFVDNGATNCYYCVSHQRSSRRLQYSAYGRQQHC